MKAVGRKFDVTAALMNALTFGLVITIIEAFTHDVHISLIIAAIVIVLFCGYFYVRREERQAYPLLPIDLLRIPLFTLLSLRLCFLSSLRCWLWSLSRFLAAGTGTR